MAKLEKYHLEYFKNPDFFKQYVQILNSRLVYSNNIIEEDNGSIGKLYDNAHVLTLKDNFKAFRLLCRKYLEDDNKKLSVEEIKEIANIINRHAMFISRGYRKIDNNVKFEDKYPIENASNIDEKIAELLDNYYNNWNDLDIFEKEAMFNIEFLRIHPFEDGNGRTSRLLLNYNVISQGHAPILMPESIREEYFKNRNRKNIKWVKELFEKESEKELKVIESLIDEYNLEKESKKEYKM